jgi:ABC-2 type transport system ATP-binding protein
MAYIIETENLTKKYKEQVSVDKVNIKVKKGEIYGFLGPNGAGKTTTIRMLLGLIQPTAGEVKIFGKNLSNNKMSILSKIGSLVESPSYYGHLTGFENLEVIRKLIGVPAKRVHEVLEIVRLERVANRLAKEYSLGMKQRLGIAIALLSNPELLILDEPTNGLDPNGIQEIRQLIRELPKRYDMTVLVSSHLLSEIDQIATQIGVLSKGKLIYQDSLESLKQQNKQKLKIGVYDWKKAETALRKRNIEVAVQDQFLWVENTDRDKIVELNHFLVQSGFSVFCLEVVHRSLEDIFLALTGSEESL